MKNNRTDWIPIASPMDWIRNHGLRYNNVVLQPDLFFIEEQDPTYQTMSLLRQQLFVNQGWRLSKQGLKLFTDKYTHYTSTHTDNRIMTGKVLLNMDNAVQGPWGYRDTVIVVFDHTIHFELQMCNGSAQQYINFKN